MATVPTKGNLIAAKKSLELSTLGYELLDRKRNILIREMMALIDKAGELQGRIDSTYSAAYSALRRANITLGMSQAIASTVPVDDGLNISYRSVMGVELPTVNLADRPLGIPFGLYNSNSMLDDAYLNFLEVKRMTAELAEIESCVYRLAEAIKKTQKRANALKNILIPRFDDEVRFITDALEEKEREEFSRMKVIKLHKANAESKNDR